MDLASSPGRLIISEKSAWGRGYYESRNVSCASYLENDASLGWILNLKCKFRPLNSSCAVPVTKLINWSSYCNCFSNFHSFCCLFYAIIPTLFLCWVNPMSIAQRLWVRHQLPFSYHWAQYFFCHTKCFVTCFHDVIATALYTLVAQDVYESYLPILAAAIATLSGGGSIAEHFRHLVRSQSQRQSTDQQIRIAIY